MNQIQNFKNRPYHTDFILETNNASKHKKSKLKLKFCYAVCTLIFSNITYIQSNIVELPSDSLPWLKGNSTPSSQPTVNTPSNSNSGQAYNGDNKEGRTDPRAKADLPPDSPEAILADEPANMHGFVVDRLLEHNYTPQDYAVLKILDKVTAKTFTVEAKVNNPFKFGWIEVTVKNAKKTPPEEEPEAVAFIEVFAQQPLKKSEHVFSGFIFASSPSISAIEHPRYDIRLFDCLTEEDLKKQAEAEAKKKEDEKKAEEEKKHPKKEKKEEKKHKDPKHKESKDAPNKNKNQVAHSGPTRSGPISSGVSSAPRIPVAPKVMQPEAAPIHDTD